MGVFRGRVRSKEEGRGSNTAEYHSVHGATQHYVIYLVIIVPMVPTEPGRAIKR